MKVLITGKNGQLGSELQLTKTENIEIICLDQHQLDITDYDAVTAKLLTERPNIVINAAAYTAVDKAESECQLAYAVNENGAENLAKACGQINAKLVHISTDFVFDGSKNTPYEVLDAVAPLGVYGHSKYAGEEKIRQLLPHDHAIIRTAWVYSLYGNNFVKTMLRLMSEKPALGVVFDQVGTPTWAKGLAQTIWKLCEEPSKIDGRSLHWTDAGVTSWYDFAVAIQELAIEKGLLKKAIPVRPIFASAYPTPAKRPHYSVLDKTQTEEYLAIEASHWRQQLSNMLDDLAVNQTDNLIE